MSLSAMREPLVRLSRSIVRRHVARRVVDDLEPIVQAHTIEGLKMGAA